MITINNRLENEWSQQPITSYKNINSDYLKRQRNFLGTQDTALNRKIAPKEGIGLHKPCKADKISLLELLDI